MWFGGLLALLMDVGMFVTAVMNPVYFYDFYLIVGVLKALDFVIVDVISKLCIWFRCSTLDFTMEDVIISTLTG